MWLKFSFIDDYYYWLAPNFPLIYILLFEGALGIKKTSLKVLFKNPTKYNIFLQLRETNLRQNDDWDQDLSFLVPILMNDKKLKVQIFASGHKKRHNLICENPDSSLILVFENGSLSSFWFWLHISFFSLYNPRCISQRCSKSAWWWEASR